MAAAHGPSSAPWPRSPESVADVVDVAQLPDGRQTGHNLRFHLMATAFCLNLAINLWVVASILKRNESQPRYHRRSLIKPRVFIGSSSEGGEVSHVLESLLSEIAVVQVWTQAFNLGDVTLDTLNRELARSDYAVLVSTSDDKVRSRGKESAVPRDNIIFEVGLFMGRLGPHRTFVVCDRGAASAVTQNRPMVVT